MKIQLNKNAVCGKVFIPKGEYLVALQAEAGVFSLTGAGLDIKIPATRRRMDSKTKTTSVNFYSGGGTTWSLIVNTPKFGEWIAMMDLNGVEKPEK
jgi:hypothetical protein